MGAVIDIRTTDPDPNCHLCRQAERHEEHDYGEDR